mmetsp:Transcript_2086/g.6166  ORF Transcript_2086/g.6166 Transcript_2086/m.6166 type:complete len:230 (+) Transcript_2086:192-881(+)
MMRCALVITAAALAASKESDTDAAYKRSRLVYEAKKKRALRPHLREPLRGAARALLDRLGRRAEPHGHGGARRRVQCEHVRGPRLRLAAAGAVGDVHDRRARGHRPRGARHGAPRLRGKAARPRRARAEARAGARRPVRGPLHEPRGVRDAADGHEERVADRGRGAGRDAHLVRKEGRALRLDVGRRRAPVSERHRVLRPEEARLQRGAPHGVMCGEDAALGARARRRI